MTKLEKIEIGLIPVAGLLTWACAPWLPEVPGVGHVTLMMSALLLLQSLLRDLSILAGTKSRKQEGQVRTMRCMCVESTVGMTGVLIGAGLFGLGFGPVVALNAYAWALAAALTLTTGFLIKDFVLQTDPWRVVRDKDHLNIVVAWRK